jgi:hypothetical protein
MACRKAAYNSLTEMSEYMEKQAEYAAAAKVKLEARIRNIWTPPDILEHCCIPWLADGTEVVGHRTNNHVTRGCSGGCGKEHPRITLDFVTKTNKGGTKGSIATLSHPLDPFVAYFGELCERGKATRIESSAYASEYSLHGFLQEHVEDLQKTDRFAYHLVKVSPTALTSSKRAHERVFEEQEELERMAKKVKTGSETHVTKSLLEQVLQICYNHGALLDHLDLLEISWMRLSGNRTMNNIAAMLAAERLRTTKLHFKPAILCESAGYRACAEPDDCQERIFSMKSSGDIGNFVSGKDEQVTWEKLQRAHACVPPLTKRYVKMALYLGAPSSEQTKSCQNLPENDCLFQQELEIGTYVFDILQITEEDIESECDNASEQTPSSKLTMKIYTGPSKLTKDANYWSNRKCTVSKLSVTLGFHHLLGIYARKKLPLAKKQMTEIKQKRPITRAEKDYVKAIAKAARDAPGNGERTFEGLTGW